MNSSFSLGNPYHQIAWDSTSLTAFKECPRKYFYSIVLGYRTQETNIHLAFGLLYHKAHEMYQHMRASGVAHDEALIPIVHRLLRDTWNYALGRPALVGDQYKNRFTLLRAVIWRLDDLNSEHGVETLILANGRPAVELSFRFDIGHSSTAGESYVMCGHIDRIARIGGLSWILDYKTTKYDISSPTFRTFYSPDNQISTYTYAAKVTLLGDVQGVVIDAAQVLVEGNRFGRVIAHRTEGQLDEWFQETIDYIDLAERYAQRGHFPMNETACGRYNGCQFREICGKDPSVRSDFLSSFKREPWDPLQVRGDV